MYEMIESMLAHEISDPQQVEFICGALILVFTVVFIDMVYRIFSHFWRGRK